MITNLHIKNIGIIDEININLNEGFNVFTGETGSGKSLIIDSLMIICGGRFSKEMIRHGQNQSFVEMALYLPNQDFEDDTVIVSREINLNGKNICKINGRLVTCAELKSFMNDIIDIHGQNDNQAILDNAKHISFLDEFASDEIHRVLQEYKNVYNEYVELNKKLKENYGDDKEKKRKLDLLKYEVSEINMANLQIGEDIELEEKRKLIVASEKISNNLQEAQLQISQNSIDGLNIAIRSIEKIESYNSSYAELLNNLKSTYYELQENNRDISAYMDELDFNPEEQKQIEDRYDFLYNLKRKYGNSIEEILDYRDVQQKEIEKIENLDNYILELKQEQKELITKMRDLANSINSIRQKYAKILSTQINKELLDLEMPNAEFCVNVERLSEKEFKSNGQDRVEFLIKTNIGEDFNPLVKIASGGEMSRIMLAIKTVLANVDKVSTLVFDEIDTGISGSSANSVGEKIKNISNNYQVICITHQASIAAKGDYNYYISKDVLNGKTVTKIKMLSELETIQEIARISSGSLTKTAIEHAKELRGRTLKLVG